MGVSGEKWLLIICVSPVSAAIMGKKETLSCPFLGYMILFQSQSHWKK